MIIHCSALLPKAEEQVKLINLLKHHGLSYEIKGDRVIVDAKLETAESAQELVAIFDSALWEARGFSVIEED